MRAVLGLALMMFSVAAAAQSIYKWVDEHGQVHYGERPPESVRANEMAVRPAAPSAASEPEEDRQELQRKMLDSYQEERARKQEQAAASAQEAEQRQRNCARSRDRFRRITEAGLLYDLDKNGERRVLSDAERAASEKQAGEAVKEWCE